MPEPESNLPGGDGGRQAASGTEGIARAMPWRVLFYALPFTAATQAASTLMTPLVQLSTRYGDVSGFPAGARVDAVLVELDAWWERLWVAWPDLMLVLVFTLAAVALDRVQLSRGRIRFSAETERWITKAIWIGSLALAAAMVASFALPLYVWGRWDVWSSPVGGLQGFMAPGAAMLIALSAMAVVYRSGRQRDEELEAMV